MNNGVVGVPSKSLMYLEKIMLANEMLIESIEKQNAYRAFNKFKKHTTVKKSANPKKKAKRKMRQFSQRKNRK